MPYIGHSPTNAGSFTLIDDIASGFNGSATAFTMQVGSVDVTPKADSLLITIDGVVQHTPEAYTVSGSTINFTSAPDSGADFYGIIMGQSASVGQGTIGADELKVSGDGTSLQVLTSDGDGTFSWLSQSSITAPAGSLTGNTLASGVTASSLTSVGTLSSLNVTGDVKIGTTSWSPFKLKVFDGNSFMGWYENNNDSELKLVAGGTDTNQAAIYFGDVGDNVHAGVRYDTSNQKLQLQAYNNNTAVTIDSSERVGIGTTSPSQLLEVEGSSAGGSLLQIQTTDSWDSSHNEDLLLLVGGNAAASNDGGKFGIRMRDGVSATKAVGIYAESDDTFSNAVDMALYTGSSSTYSEKVRITDGGNVGIGTNDPIADLSIVDSSTGSGIEIQPELTTDTNRITNFDRAESVYKKFRLDASEQQFYISGTEKMRIDSSGNVIFQDGCPIQADTGRATNVSVGTSYVNILDFSTLGGVTAARGFYLVTVVRAGASVGTSIVLLIGVSTASNAYIYETVSATNLTAQMSGANLQVKTASNTITCHATAVPIGITGTD